MGSFIEKYLDNRTWRHIGFWSAWVIGFTFIQSYGKSHEYYFGWIFYYILTLPIFIAHTYLVAYVLIPRFLTKRLWPIFIISFFLALYGFSFLELVLSNEFIFIRYPTGTHLQENYLNFGNVTISGLGNLYIVLVFLAIRTIRHWNLANNQKKELEQEKLQQQIEDTVSRVQPRMLLYAVDQIEKMVERADPEVAAAIALMSEILNDVMMFNREEHQPFLSEVELIKKLLILVSHYREDPLEVEIFLSGDPGQIRFPPMLLFSLVDMLIREFDHLPVLPEINIEASGFSNMITVLILSHQSTGNHPMGELFNRIIQRLGSFCGSDVRFTWEKHSYGLSLIMNAIHRSSEAVYMPVAPAG